MSALEPERQSLPASTAAMSGATVDVDENGQTVYGFEGSLHAEGITFDAGLEGDPTGEIIWQFEGGPRAALVGYRDIDGSLRFKLRATVDNDTAYFAGRVGEGADTSRELDVLTRLGASTKLFRLLDELGGSDFLRKASALGGVGEIVAADLAPGATGLTLIQDRVLDAPTASIDLTAIPATYRHLLLIAELRSSAAGAATAAGLIRLNGDSGASYDYHALAYNAGDAALSSVAGAAATSIPLALHTQAGSRAGRFGSLVMELVAYRNTTREKAGQLRASVHDPSSAGASLHRTRWGGWSWRSVAAINRITILPASGNFAAESRASLYGYG